MDFKAKFIIVPMYTKDEFMDISNNNAVIIDILMDINAVPTNVPTVYMKTLMMQRNMQRCTRQSCAW